MRFVFLIISIYVFIRGLQTLPRKTPVLLPYTLLFVFFTASYYVSHYLSDLFQPNIVLVARQTGGHWVIILLVAFFAVVLLDVIRLLNRFLNIYPYWLKTNYPRVKVYVLISVIVISIFISFIGFRNFAHPRKTLLDLKINKEIDSTGFLILAASDFHLGNIIGKERLAEWVDIMNAQHADVILLAGDIFDRNFNAFISREVDDELSKLKARYGVYAVLGNHEYEAGLDEVIRCLERSGITLMRDSVINLTDRVYIAGRDDRGNYQRMSLDSLLKHVPPEFPLIVMDHQPAELSEVAKYPIDLHVSGHLHNGQIYPFNRLFSDLWELPYGYRKIGNVHFYVTSGLGIRRAPIRLGTYSEFALIHLHSTYIREVE